MATNKPIPHTEVTQGYKRLGNARGPGQRILGARPLGCAVSVALVVLRDGSSVQPHAPFPEWEHSRPKDADKYAAPSRK